MNNKLRNSVIVLALLALFTLNSELSTASAQGTAFTYDGQIQLNGRPAGGTYNMTFAVFNTNVDGTAIAGPITNNAVGVTNGLFTVQIDFGSGVFIGASNWLEIGVETNGASSFIILVPRQELTPVPYAIYAESATMVATGASIGAGYSNSISSAADDAFIGGGYENQIQSGSVESTIGGGDQNQIQSLAFFSTIGGGAGNQIQTGIEESTIGGGGGNMIQAGGDYSTIGGGFDNATSESYATVCGGYANSASGTAATVGGGDGNSAQGDFSFAAGYFANASLDNTFVWNSFPAAATSFADHCFYLFGDNGLDVEYFSQRPDGGGTHWATIGTGAGQTISTWTGAFLSDSGVWQNASDRNRKTAFAAVDPQEVLAKVAAMPVQSWRYTNEMEVVRHLGPTAQDFRDSFGLGTDDKSIGTVDEEGVALAAIQGLNQKVNQQDAEIQNLKRQNDTLAQRLNELEATVRQLAARKSSNLE
jgi:hypothetical protein